MATQACERYQATQIGRTDGNKFIAWCEENNVDLRVVPAWCRVKINRALGTLSFHGFILNDSGKHRRVRNRTSRHRVTIKYQTQPTAEMFIPV